MTEKLAGLVIPVLEPLGYQQGWGMATVARIRKEIPDDVGRLTLRQQNIDEVMTCGGLSAGARSRHRDSGPCVLTAP
jgi:hypothetical protein